MEEANYKETEATKTGYKKIKFGSVPDEWKIMRLDDVFEFLPTTSFSRNDLQYETLGVAYIHYGDIHATYDSQLLNISEQADIPFLKEDIDLPKTVAYLRTGDLVVADASEDYTGVGACIEIICDSETKAISGLHTFALRPKEGITAGGFRTYLLKHPRVGIELKKIVTGSKVYGLSKANFVKFEVVLPPLPEQRKIAEILSTWDRAIDALTKLIEKKKERKKGLMQVLLSGELRFHLLKSLGNKEGDQIDWEEARIDEIFGFLSTTSFSRNDLEYSSDPQRVKNIHYGDIHAKYDQVILDLKQNMDVPVLKELVALPNKIELLHSGDIVVADASEDYAGVADCIELKNVGEHNVIAGLHTLALRDKSGRTVSGVRGYLLKSKKVVKRLRQLATGSKVYGISKRNLASVIVSLPSKIEQQKIASLLSSADQEIEKLEGQLKKLEMQKKGLMQKLLTGEVRVTSMNK